MTVMEYFFKNPTQKLRVRQIEREAKVPLPSAIRYAKELEQESILKPTEIGGIKLYSADLSSRKYKAKKQLFNLERIYSSGLIEYLIDKYDNPSIIVFGSFSKGEDTEKSDVDIYIETPHRKVVVPSTFEKRIGLPLQLFVHKGLDEIDNINLKNNIVNGIVLNCFVEAFR